MSRANSHYTFLIIPKNTSKIRRLNVSMKFIYGSCGVFVAILGIGALGLVRLAQRESLELRYLAVRSENEKLRTENNLYENSYTKLKGQISFIEDESKELARQAKMEPIADVDDHVGVGGPETAANMDKAADQLEHQVRIIGDRLRSDQLRLASVPSGLPVSGYQTAGFGVRRNPFGDGGSEFHEGVDLAVEFGTPVGATADGLVVWAGPYSGYGNLVAILHSNGITTRYGHLSKVAVEVGQRIKRGDQIGYAGSTGRSTGPHVHYEIRINDQPVDPARYLGQPHP
ncbi:MAG TPA: peptidoglycan DD-metalloendopeptidase family protein [Blastocatellia bacterium]|nr:peptidoglycan DD-metalloendopeptidase family protein [Blastocatellia bacterium]